jgi:hypothetical protein
VGQSAVEVFEQIKRSYPAASRGSRTMHEAFSLLESELRFVALLAAATMRSAGRSVRVGRSPGLGDWVSFLRSVGPELDEVGTEPALLVERMVGEVLEQYDQSILAAPRKLSNVKALRDHVMHGGALPDGRIRAIYNQVDQLVERISGAIVTGLADATVTSQATNSPDEQRLGFVWAGDEIPLWPYMYAHRTASDAEPQLHVFASFMKATPTYLCFGDGDDVLRHPSGEILLTALGKAVKSRPPDKQFAAFVNAVQSWGLSRPTPNRSGLRKTTASSTGGRRPPARVQSTDGISSGSARLMLVNGARRTESGWSIPVSSGRWRTGAR